MLILPSLSHKQSLSQESGCSWRETKHRKIRLCFQCFSGQEGACKPRTPICGAPRVTHN